MESLAPPHDPVLVVEDNADTRDAILEALHLIGFRVEAAEDGASALRLLHDGPRPCLILLDLALPVMDGWEFRVRQLDDPDLASIPVVAVSARSEEIEDRGIGFDAVLPKPFEVEALEDVVLDCCAR